MRQRVTRKSKIRGKARKDRGVALITALILLLLLTAMGVAMMLSVNSDMLINGYYRNFRGSFYAADAGLNIVRQQIYNSLQATVPVSFSATAQPIPNGSEATVKANINAAYGTYQKMSGTNSWPGQFKVNLDTLVLASCETPGGDKTSTCAAPVGKVTEYKYHYNYHMIANGQTTGSQKASLEETGSITITAVLAPAADTLMSFAAWGMFIDQSPACPTDKSYLVPGTISGPVFTNGGWTFSDTGTYHFTDTVGSAGGQAGYLFTNSTNSPCVLSSGASAQVKKNGPTIAPTFDVPPKWGQAAVPLPSNDFNQQRAVLDGKGMGPGGTPGTKPSLAEMQSQLLDGKHQSYNGKSGVYLPYSYDPSTKTATFNGGGIYVEGDASIKLSTFGASGQRYDITDAKGNVTTIKIDNVANTTTIDSGSGPFTITGVPRQLDPDTGNFINDSTMLYVNGNVTALQGPGQGQAAIQDDTALTITAAQNVTITGDVLYKTEPVTLTKNQVVSDASSPCCSGQDADTLIPGHDKGQALGIFTATGDINLNNLQSNKNLEIDASLAAISNGGTGGLVNTGANINNLTIVGGRIQNSIKGIGATTRNVFFDKRYSQGGFAPPWFPSTHVTNAGKDSATLSAQFSRTQWLSQTSY
jgi:Tfp pilus assembly protein PilX